MRMRANQELQLSPCRATFLLACRPMVARARYRLNLALRTRFWRWSTAAHPDKSAVWSVSGPSCPLLCGSVDASGNYTAPQILPASPNVTLTARSVADSSRQVSASITITSNFLPLLSVPSTVAASSTATFIATLKPVPGSNPSTSGTKCVRAGKSQLHLLQQEDLAFTPGVLAFTRVITADRIGVQFGSGAPSSEVGEILDADIYFNPSDSRTSYATPLALTSTPAAYDMESILTHEMGHALGFSHSAVWSAIMFPFAPTVGTFSGIRPSQGQPDAPLGDDDRTGLRVLYPDPSDTLHVGAIRGHILNANPSSLPASPPGVTGVFGSHVVAVDAASGAVVGAAVGGWTCNGPGPAQFDGSYAIERLPVGSSYLIYAEPLNGAVDPSEISNATASLCRNVTSDPGWPSLQGCVAPPVDVSFTVIRVYPKPLAALF